MSATDSDFNATLRRRIERNDDNTFTLYDLSQFRGAIHQFVADGVDEAAARQWLDGNDIAPWKSAQLTPLNTELTPTQRQALREHIADVDTTGAPELAAALFKLRGALERAPRPDQLT